jgi:hypothetical protein
VQVMINDCPVEFGLDSEKSVSDIIQSVAEWTRQRDLVFYELYIDDSLYAIDAAPDRSLDDVKVINCIVQSKADIVFSTADEAMRYCDRIEAFAARGGDSAGLAPGDRESLATGVSWLLEVLFKVMALLGIDRAGVRFRDREISYYLRVLEGLRDALATAGDAPDLSLSADAYAGIFSDIKGVLRMLLLSDAMRSLIVQSIDSPDVLLSSLRQTESELTEQLKNVEAAAVAYQTGKDVDAAGRLKGFIDFIYRYTRTCSQIMPVFRVDLDEVEVDGVSMEKKNRDMRNMLHGVIEVMENNDIISLSDILEYEIKPALENLRPYVELLLGRISLR